MRFNIVFIKSEDRFNKRERQKIENTIKSVVKHAAKLLKFKQNRIINFTVYRLDGKFTFGCTYSKDWIHLNVIKKFEEEDLSSAIYHEMHHIARGYYFFSKKRISFLETLFSEGLAVIFETEQLPKRIPVYAEYSDDFIKKWLPQVRKEGLWRTDFSHDEWFWGKRGKPYHLGYKLGTYLVNQIKKHNPKLTADKLTKKNVKTLLRLSKVKL